MNDGEALRAKADEHYEPNGHMGRARYLSDTNERRDFFGRFDLVQYAESGAADWPESLRAAGWWLGRFTEHRLCAGVSQSLRPPRSANSWQIGQRNAQTQFFVPEGNGALLRRAGVCRITELNWGEQVTVGQVVIHCSPA